MNKLREEEIAYLFGSVVQNLLPTLKKILPVRDKDKHDLSQPDGFGWTSFTLEHESDLSMFEENELEIRTWLHKTMSQNLDGWDRIEIQTRVQKHPIKRGYPVTEREIEADEAQIVASAHFVVNLFAK